MVLLSCKEKTEKVVEGSAWKVALLCLIWSIWKERNRIVFEHLPLSYTRLKNSFISSFSIWAGLLDLGEDSFVKIFCAFSKIVFWVVGFLCRPSLFV